MYKHVFIFICFIIIMFFSCKKVEKADFVVYNATIYTVDSNFTITEAMAVKNGKILECGTNKFIKEKYKTNSLIDLEGKFVYPGFFDAHCHFYGYGLSLKWANLRGTKSFDEILEVLKKHHEKYHSEWVLGRGWDQNDWKEKDFPTKEKLDELFPNIPVLLTRVDGHAVLVNSEALKRAKITADTKIEGGDILLLEGEPTGILLENAADKLKAMIPEPNDKDNIQALIDAGENCYSVGLTSVGDAGLDKEIVLLIDSLQKNQKLRMRINAFLTPNKENIKHFVEKGIYQTDFLTVRSIKLYADGALGSRGACMIEPYSDDPDNYGIMVLSRDSLKKLSQIAYDNNYQVCTHAIGDSANRVMLSIYGAILGGKNDRRWRIEHAQVINENDFQLFKKYSIVPSIQTTHATSDMYWAEERVGKERIKGAYAYKRLLELNGWLPNGSDFPVEEINPLYGFYSAVARKDFEGYPDSGFQIDNALTREQALRAMTIWAAKIEFNEEEKGSLEPGKFADFVVLDKDIMKIDLSEIPNQKVVETYIAGDRVYTGK